VTDIVELFAELSLKSVMKIQTQIIDIEDIAVEIIRKSVKNWRLLVNLQGHVRITVPTRASETAIRCAIAPKLDWIRKKQATFLAHPITPLHRYIHGETHPLWGEAYQLHVIDRILYNYASTSTQQQNNVRPICSNGIKGKSCMKPPN